MRVITALAVAIAVLAGCTSKGDSSPASSTAELTSEPTSPAPTSTAPVSTPASTEESSPATAAPVATTTGSTELAAPVEPEDIPEDVSAVLANTNSLFAEDGSISHENALAAFANFYGPVPGVDPWPGRLSPFIGGLVYDEVLHHYDDLLPEQQQYVDLVRGPRGEVVFTGPGNGPSRRVHASPGSGVVPVTPLPGEVIAEFHAARDYLAARLSWQFPDGFDVYASYLPQDNPVTGFPNFTGVEGATNTSIVETSLGRRTVLRCEIRLNSARNTSLPILRSMIVHELFHCLQSILDPNEKPKWVSEGSAAWVTTQYTGIVTYHDWWTAWLDSPSNRMKSMNYQALGFYALLQRSGVDLWTALPDLITNPDPEVLLSQLSDRNSFYELWGTHFANQVAWGTPYVVIGEDAPNRPGRAESVIVGEDPVGVALGSSELPTGYEETLFAAVRNVEVEAPVLRVRATTDTNGGIHIGSFSGRLSGIDVALCTRADGCPCPNGNPPRDLLIAGTNVAYVGVGPSGANATVKFVGQSIDEFCQDCPIAPLSRSAGAGGFGRHAAAPPDGGVCRPATPPETPATNDCAVGVWRSLEWYGSGDPLVPNSDPFTAGGDGVVLTLNPDGSMLLDYSTMTPLLKRDVADGNTIDIQLLFTGAAAGTWSTGADGRLTGAADTRGVQILGSITAGNQTLQVLDANLAALSASAGGATGTPYTVANCSGSGMAIETVFQTTTAGILFERVG